MRRLPCLRFLRATELRIILVVLVLGFGLSHFTVAESPNPDRFGLRVYIFSIASRAESGRAPKHPSDMPDFLAGSGQADLFESGEPHAFQFTFSCTAGMTASAGYVTFPARWKKPGKTLEVLLPQRGKPDSMEPCDLQVEFVPDLAYFWKNGALAAGPPAPLVDWMKKHRFDPENGSEEPMLLPGDSADTDPFRAPE